MGGHVDGELHQGGTAAGDQLTPTASHGKFDLDVGGACGDTKTEVLDTRPAGGLPQSGFPYSPLGYMEPQDSIPTDNGGGYVPAPDPAVAAHLPVWPNGPAGARMIITRSVNVPTFQIDEKDSDTDRTWGLNDLHVKQTRIDKTATSGDYVNCLFTDNFPSSGHADMSDTITTVTQEDSNANGIGGTQTRTEEVAITTTNGIITPGADISSGTVSLAYNWKDVDVVGGNEGAAGKATADLTEQRDVTGSSTFTYQVFWNHTGDNGMSGYDISTLNTVRDYHTTKAFNPNTRDPAGNVVALVTKASGTDTRNEDYIFHTTITGGHTIDFNQHRKGAETHKEDGTGGVAETFSFPGGTWTEDISDDPHGTYSNQNPGTPPGPVDNRDWFAKAADFAAGMGDAVSCGLTQQIRQAAGYDDVVDKTSGWYQGGEIAGTAVAIAAGGVNPCTATRGIGTLARGVAAVQGAGHLSNAVKSATSDPPDPLGFALNIVGARMSFAKMNAACFAAGTPIEKRHGCVAVETIRRDDETLSQDEHDPISQPSTRRVISTYVGMAPVWHLHVGGRVIRTTGGHPFWVRGQGWTTVAELRPGQELRTGQGGWRKVGEVVDTGRSEPVYNLEVDGDHTYFVGDPVTWGYSLWAHNGCGVHGNSLRSTRPTTLYQKVNATTGAHLKFGISSDVANRYSQVSLNRNNERIIELMTGTRAQIAAIERSAASQMPGPQNLEAWAGSMIRGLP